jgi:hypothetical protein
MNSSQQAFSAKEQSGRARAAEAVHTTPDRRKFAIATATRNTAITIVAWNKNLSAPLRLLKVDARNYSPANAPPRDAPRLSEHDTADKEYGKDDSALRQCRYEKPSSVLAMLPRSGEVVQVAVDKMAWYTAFVRDEEGTIIHLYIEMLWQKSFH